MNTDYQYLVGRIQAALAAHPRTNKLDVKVMIAGGKIHLMGQTSTEERRHAIAEPAFDRLPVDHRGLWRPQGRLGRRDDASRAALRAQPPMPRRS